jgi:uncharacterized protein (TIGR02246 family)
MRTAVVLIFLAVAVTLGAAQTRPEEKALRDLWNQFENAFNDGDARTVASLFSTDADRVTGTGEWVRGRADIRKQYEAMLAKRKADPTSQPLNAALSIRFLRSDVAILDGRWEGVRSGERVRGHFTLVATREKGRWWLAAGRAWDLARQ